MVTRTKARYEKDICDKSKDNPKRFWKLVRQNLNTKSTVYPLLKSPTDKTSVKFDVKDKADILQNQFCSVFIQEPEGTLPDFPLRTNKKVEINITKEMIRIEINCININKSIEPDEVHPKMLKKEAFLALEFV